MIDIRNVTLNDVANAGGLVSETDKLKARIIELETCLAEIRNWCDDESIVEMVDEQIGEVMS